jgi:hypothetical protein
MVEMQPLALTSSNSIASFLLGSDIPFSAPLLDASVGEISLICGVIRNKPDSVFSFLCLLAGWSCLLSIMVSISPIQGLTFEVQLSECPPTTNFNRLPLAVSDDRKLIFRRMYS